MLLPQSAGWLVGWLGCEQDCTKTAGRISTNLGGNGPREELVKSGSESG